LRSERDRTTRERVHSLKSQRHKEEKEILLCVFVT
jgi:hypothetical protein